MRTLSHRIGIALCWLALLLSWVVPAGAVSPQFSADCQALTAGNHRLVGSPESEAAARYVEQRLRGMGIAKVVVQSFPTVRMVIKRCEMIMGARTLALLPARPNGIIPPVTPPQGITGQLLYANDGDIRAYGTRSPRGKIVVLDYNSGSGWLRAFRLGAQAVIFVNNGTPQSWQPHHTEASTNFPRFYYQGDRRQLVEGKTVTIHSEVVWQQSQGHNVIAYLPGTKPVFSLKQPEVVLLSANLDSYGDIPHLSPGARGAANCAALLQIAGYLQENRPRRDVALCFFDGQAHGHEGVAAFYRIFETDNQLVKLQTRERFMTEEQKFCRAMQNALENPVLLAKKSAVTDEVLKRLRAKAEGHVAEISLQQELMRKAAANGNAPSSEDATAAEAGKEAKTAWNNLRRILARPQRLAHPIEPALATLLNRITIEVQGDLNQRNRELRENATAIRAEKTINKWFGKSHLCLHSSLMLGDTTSRWGLVIGGDSVFHIAADQAGLYQKVQSTFLDAAKSTIVPHFETASADGTMNTRQLFPAPLIHSGEVAGRLGIYNIVFGTEQELLPFEGTPGDTLQTIDLDRIALQANEIATLVAATASKNELSLRRSIGPDKYYIFPEYQSNGQTHGARVMGMTAGSTTANTPMPGAVVQFFLAPLTNFAYQQRKLPAFENYLTLMTDANATYRVGPVPVDTYNAFLRGFAVTFDAHGQVVSASDVSSQKSVLTRLNVFPCVVPGIRDGKAVMTQRMGAMVLAPQVESADTKVMWSMMDSTLDPAKTFSATVDGVTYWYCERRIDGVKLFGLQSIVALNNGEELAQEYAQQPAGNEADEAKRALGTGFSLLAPSWIYPSSAIRSAGDIWRLNDYRLNIMRRRGIINSSLEELQGRSFDLWQNASAAKTVAAAEANATSSLMSSRPVYLSIRQSLDDLVRAVLILLALAIPFAFALERLLIGASNIYRQITWFCGFFAVTFLILFLVHPAFAVSNQSIIIFLAFALLMLSGLVIVVLMQKFETELKVLQGLTSTVHTADVSRFSTMMAAVGMGISTMRRRPLRTALTALTITLLTYTILNFASFDTRTGIVTLFDGSSPKYTGVLLHKVNWAPLDTELLGVLHGRWDNNSTVLARYWLPATTTPATERLTPLISHGDGSAPMPLRGLLGIDPAELAFRPDIKRMLRAEASALDNGIFLTGALAQQIGVKTGDEVLLCGIRLRIQGLLDPAVVGAVKDMDDSGIMPVDFSSTSSSTSQVTPQQQATGADVLAAAQNRQDWMPLPIDTVVIVSADTAKRLGASLRVVTLYTADPQAATSIAEDMARMLPLPVSATRSDGVYTHVLAPTVMAKGLKDLIFPILLGAMVIFGTMLGSVADREREIYTFSALGLAPAHVATLFFAEAMVYSFVGGMGGYLLAQGTLKILTVLSNAGLVHGVPEMNYSSFNAIIAILIVMATVLVSAIYPAYKASHSANPGVLRSWKTPKPEGDRFNIVFPFTVSQYDITGVVSFLKEHFDNFSDTSLGVFMAKNTELLRDGHSLGLRSHLALAPFDLGVTQEFVLRSVPSEIPGIDEVKIELLRLSGQHKDWERLNKVLLDDLRRQFLIWRALPQETMEMYRQRTLAALGDISEAKDDVKSPSAPQTV